MKVNFNVKYKFKINGREYGSLEEMPVEIREAYEKAVGNKAGQEVGNVQSISHKKIIFNGQEYESEDSMPSEIRHMYETIMESVKNREISQDGNSAKIEETPVGFKNEGATHIPNAPRPISPESFISARILIIAAAVIALLAGIYILFGGK